MFSFKCICVAIISILVGCAQLPDNPELDTSGKIEAMLLGPSDSTVIDVFKNKFSHGPMRVSRPSSYYRNPANASINQTSGYVTGSDAVVTNVSIVNKNGMRKYLNNTCWIYEIQYDRSEGRDCVKNARLLFYVFKKHNKWYETEWDGTESYQLWAEKIF